MHKKFAFHRFYSELKVVIIEINFYVLQYNL